MPGNVAHTGHMSARAKTAGMGVAQTECTAYRQRGTKADRINRPVPVTAQDPGQAQDAPGTNPNAPAR
eukprot:531760-Lingulodinium_polyedra.AAC.1